MSKIALIKEIYQLDENDLPMRKEALEKIAPYAQEIMDRFYERLLEKEEFKDFIPEERIPELKRKQIDFVASLLSEPFDDRLYAKIAKVGIAHYHIRLDPLYMSYGYHLLSELILALSKKEPSLLPYLKLIIKYLKVAEAIMGEEYFAQKSLEHSPYRGNDLFLAVNRLHRAYMVCRASMQEEGGGKPDEAHADRFFESLDDLKPYRGVLKEAGLDLAVIRRHCTELLHADSPQESGRAAEALERSIIRPLNDLGVTAYLSLSSSLAAVRAMTDIVYRRSVMKNAQIDRAHVENNIETILTDTYGWAIDRLEFLDEEPGEEACDIVKHLYFDRESAIVYLCIILKDVSNRIYIQEGIDLLAETMKLTLFLRMKAG
ncbi:protoglobin domain-containing protein [Hydrogenimonas sp. SS33]|uniref:protoglobin domain-containing protein n=1 Tax=Hydrogenimonas leucolamina TaxID=2954236 RepID=UPI00336BB1D9